MQSQSLADSVGLVHAPEREQRQQNQAPRRWVRVVARLTAGGALALLATMVVLRAWSTETVADIVGSRAFVATSGSMTPVFDAGDVVIIRETSPNDIRVGDIVTFSNKSNPTQFITHRVVRIEPSLSGGVAFATKGDANRETDESLVDASRLVGAYSRRVPLLGTVALTYGFGPLLLLLLAILLAFAALKSGRIRVEPGRRSPEAAPTHKRERKRK